MSKRLMICSICCACAGTFLAAPASGIPRTQTARTRMETIVRSTFGLHWAGATMLCIAIRESNLNPRAANWTDSNGGSFGLFQINGIWRNRGESTMHFARRMWNPWENARMARRLYITRGFEPWGGQC